MPVALALAVAAPAIAAPTVVVSIKPIFALIADVMDGVGAPTLLLPAATSPHVYTLRPSDGRALESAEVVFWIGPELETFLEKPITMQKLLKAVEAGLARNGGVGVRKGGVAGTAVAPAAELTVEAAMTGGQSLPLAVEMGPQARQLFELDKPLRDARDEFEKSYFEFHLAKEGGSMTRVAEKTGLERTHLYRKLKQLGVDLSRGKRGGG